MEVRKYFHEGKAFYSTRHCKATYTQLFMLSLLVLDPETGGGPDNRFLDENLSPVNTARPDDQNYHYFNVPPENGDALRTPCWPVVSGDVRSLIFWDHDPV